MVKYLTLVLSPDANSPYGYVIDACQCHLALRPSRKYEVDHSVGSDGVSRLQNQSTNIGDTNTD